jgi:DNA-binding PadR family transcriptional regulator
VAGFTAASLSYHRPVARWSTLAPMSSMTTEEIHAYLQNPDARQPWYFPGQVARDRSDLMAILLYDIYVRTRNRKKAKDGYKWTFDAMRIFAENHPYASEAGIRKAFLELEKAGLIVIDKTGKRNRRRDDRKRWYRLTDAGGKAAPQWRIAHNPDVAAASKSIPQAVLLEHFRHEYHKAEDIEYVRIDPDEINLPYSAKTIERHLDKLIAEGFLARDSDDDDR